VTRAAKAFAKRHWPQLRLRTILLGTMLFVAAMPGISAVFLRVYENTLVRQTESELITQGAALAAAAGNRFSDSERAAPVENRSWYESGRSASETVPPFADPVNRPGNYFRPEPPGIDLSADALGPERPEPQPTSSKPSADSLAMAAALEPVLVQTSRTTLASIILLDPDGLVLTGAYRGLSYANVPEVRAALGGKSVTKLRRNGNYQARYSFEWLSRAAPLRVHHVRPIIAGGKVKGVLLLSRSSRALFRGMYQDRGKIAIGAGLIFLILLVLTLLLQRSIAKPIEALSLATRDVADGRGDIPETPATAAVEIRALYEDFAHMAAVIARRSRYLRDFAAAVSHEFKTPLAGIRGGIELIEDHHGTMSAAERAQFLGNISADANRLSHLVSRLLDLARADMARPDAGAATDLLAALPPIIDAMRAAGFTVKLECSTEVAPVAVPSATIETIVVGLIENSRQAGASAATVLVKAGSGAVQLILSDNGPGIAVADAERMFEPFFTTRRAEGGTGLGLSIARSLIEANHGAIDWIAADQGATFRLTLPTVGAGTGGA
jgi:signal transduction histidine kinase